MKPSKNTIFCGGNLEVVSSWPSNFVSAIVTDPPYGLGFMGKDWDTLIEKTRDSAGGFLRDGKSGSNPYAAARCRHGSDSVQMQDYYYQWAKAMFRITKSGGFMLCFGGTRTFHRLACAIEDAGWEIRDCMMFLYGTGFPKSHNIGKAIDKVHGNKRKFLGMQKAPGYAKKEVEMGKQNRNVYDFEKTKGDSAWEGYGTAMKPAWEPILVCMKPLDGTFAHNAEKHGVAGLNINGGRIGTGGDYTIHDAGSSGSKTLMWNRGEKKESGKEYKMTKGRWPANLLLDENVAEGESWKRYFYCPKTSRKERNMGLEDQSGKKVNDGRQTPIDNPYQRGETIRSNTHPTVKPLALMKYLCTLLKMPSAEQIILDPFLGSGTTGMACKELGINFIGIEKEREYCEIAVKRIAAVPGQEITLHTESTLPVTKNVETVRTTTGFVSGGQRQKIINDAVTKLKARKL